MSEESIEIPWVLDPPPTLDDLPTSFSNDNNDNISVDMNAKSIKSKRKKSILLAICSITFIAIAALGASIGRRNNNNNKASSVVVSDICLKDEDVFITAADDDKSYYTTDGDTMNSNDLLASNDMFPLILSENDGPFRRRGLRRDIKNRALTMNTIRGSGTRVSFVFINLYFICDIPSRTFLTHMNTVLYPLHTLTAWSSTGITRM